MTAIGGHSPRLDAKSSAKAALHNDNADQPNEKRNFLSPQSVLSKTIVIPWKKKIEGLPEGSGSSVVCGAELQYP